MAENISFQSDGLKIAGLIDTPPDYKAGERRPAFIVRPLVPTVQESCR